MEVDACGTYAAGEALLRDVANRYIQSTKRIVGAVVVKDLVVIDTPDALLVADRTRVQDVERIDSQFTESARGGWPPRLHISSFGSRSKPG